MRLLGSILALFAAASLFGQSTTTTSTSTTPTRTPWHVTSTYSFTHPGPAGTAVAEGQDISAVPVGYRGVIEYLSARCVGSPSLTIVYAEVLVSSDPLNPGQSGVAGAPSQADTSNIALLFTKSYSDSGTNVFLAAQSVTLRISSPGLSPPVGRVMFHGDFFDPASDSATMTCLLSISGYLETL
jgi:hypothetical protein